MASGLLDRSFQGHLVKAKENGITKNEIVEVITHLAFYAGWPKAWAAFALAQDVFAEEATAPHQE
jgi:alkylhydroperoxidase/carboxymuconolactone decarboxylase family protein YurZ